MRTRLPAQISSTGQVTSAPSMAVGRERFTPDTVKDPITLAEQLTRMQANLEKATQHARANPEAGAVTYRDVACGTGGALLRITHGLGHPAEWRATRFRDPAGAAALAGVSLVEDATSDNSTLVLRSYQAGIANLKVW